MQTVRFLTLICLFLCAAVVLNSVHSKDLAAASQTNGSRLQVHDDNSVQKIHTELHNHVDKAGKVFTDNPQTDTRSLRMLHNRRSHRLAQLNDLFNSWRQQLALHLS